MNLEESINNYQPSAQARMVVQQARIVLLTGIAGAGKDTIKNRLLQKNTFMGIVSHTTRPPRINDGIAEVDGVDYHFIDSHVALGMVQKSEFIEVKFVHGTVYGTSVAEVKRAHDISKVALMDVDVQGVAEYKAISSHVTAIYILPPNYDTWIERMSKRYASEEEFQTAFPTRKESAVNELRHALEVPYYHFVTNNDLEEAVRVVDEIAHKPDDVFHRKDDEARLAARDLLDAIISHS